MRIDLSIGSRDGPLGLTLLARYPISAVDVSTGARIETVATLPLAGERVFSATLVCPAPGRWQVHSPAQDSAAGNTLQLDVLPGSPEACQFTLGFAALHDQIPDVVGTCTSDEQHDPTHGDALQTTTTGLLVWRTLDNWTAFTDGTSTWIDGEGRTNRGRSPRRFAKRGDRHRFSTGGPELQALWVSPPR